MRPVRTLTAVAAASVLTLSLAACGGDDEPAVDKTTHSATADDTTAADDAATDDATDDESEPADDESADADASADGKAPWARPVTTPGDKVSTVKAGDVTVDIYQVGTAKATESGFFVDPDTNKPIIAEGDDIVYVNYVVTNNGDPIDLGSSYVSIELRYDDWPYMQGMDATTDDDQYAEMDVNPEPDTADSYNEEGIYTLGTGESYSAGTNFRYEKGQPFTADVSYTPVDAKGDLLHDQRVEGEGTGTIS